MAKYLIGLAASLLFAGNSFVAGVLPDGGNLNVARWSHTVTALPDGTAVVIGGGDGVGGKSIGVTEVFDPISLAWTALPQSGSLGTPRFNHRSVLMPTGEVYVVGGEAVYGFPANPIVDVEVYDPSGQTFSPASSLLTSRTAHGVVVLNDGRILAVGGATSNGVVLNSVEVFDPVTGSWELTGALNEARYFHATVLLKDGRVLVAGGSKGKMNTVADDLNSVEIYDPSTGVWSVVAPLPVKHIDPIFALLDDGKVLIAAGFNSAVSFLKSTEIYDVDNDIWTPSGDTVVAVDTIAFTKLFDGKVIATGGNTGGSYITTVQEYDPATGLWTQINQLSIARHGHTTTLLNDGLLVIAGGADGNWFPISSTNILTTSAPCNGHGSLGWNFECSCDFGFQGAICGECVNGNTFPDCVVSGKESIDVSQGIITERPVCEYEGDLGASVPYLVCTLNFVGSGDAVIYTEVDDDSTDPLLYLFENGFSDSDYNSCSDDFSDLVNSAIFIQASQDVTYFIVATVYDSTSGANFSVGVNSAFDFTLSCGPVDAFGASNEYYLGKPYFDDTFDHAPVFPFITTFDSEVRRTLKTYYIADEEGLAVEYGIEVPFGHTLGSNGYPTYFENEPPAGPSNVAVLPFDINAADAGVPINHVGLFYNPWGHGGNDDWMISHYDMHFHLDTPHSVAHIKCADPTALECSAGPEDQAIFAKDTRAIPANFACDHGVALMGAHCFDPTEVSDFYTTPAYLLGTYKGEFNFIEPMVSLLALDNVSDEVCWEVPQLECHHKAGFYPTKICLKKVNINFVRIAFTNLLWQSADCDFPVFSGKVSSLDFATLITAEPVNRKKSCVVFNENVLEAGWIAQDGDNTEYCCRSHGIFDLMSDECLVNCDRHSLVDAPFLRDTSFNRCYFNCHPL